MAVKTVYITYMVLHYADMLGSWNRANAFMCLPLPLNDFHTRCTSSLEAAACAAKSARSKDREEIVSTRLNVTTICITFEAMRDEYVHERDILGTEDIMFIARSDRT